MDKIEKIARLANLFSLVFCIFTIFIDLKSSHNFILGTLALLQIIHVFFGDVTDSYRLLIKRMFLRFYTGILWLFFVLLIIILFVGTTNNKMYFSSVLLAFLGDFIANKLRVKKLNIEKNTKRKRNK